jgi:hypothetical protein
MSPMLLMLATIAVVVLTAAIVVAMHLAREHEGSDDDLSRAGRARDARGRQVKLLDPVPMYVLGRHHVIERDVLEPICEALEPGVVSRRRWILVPILVVGGVLVLVGLSIALEGKAAWSDLVSTLLNPAIMAAVIGGGVAPWFAARQQRLHRVKHVMLHHGRCPHCGYGLSGVPAAADGNTVCPECACAWRMDDASRGAGQAPRAAAGDLSTRTILLLMLGGLAALAAFALFMYMR